MQNQFMTDTASKRIFIIISSIILIPTPAIILFKALPAISLSENFWEYFDHISGLSLFGFLWTGFFIYLFLGPWLLKKYGKRTFTESYVLYYWKNFESELKDIAPSINDSSIKITFAILKIWKIGILISIILKLFSVFINA